MCLIAKTSKPGAAQRRLCGRSYNLVVSFIDTASTYGDAESVLGEVIAHEGTREKLFIAIKLEAPHAAELCAPCHA